MILLIINSPFQPGDSSTGSTIDRLQNKCLLKVRGASSTNHWYKNQKFLPRFYVKGFS